MKHGQSRMGYTIEHIGLDRGVMDHILENQLLADLELMIELPVSEEITGETTVAAQPVNVEG